MIPSDIVVLDKFPYNSNHKIDKNELINIYKSTLKQRVLSLCLYRIYSSLL